MMLMWKKRMYAVLSALLVALLWACSGAPAEPDVPADAISAASVTAEQLAWAVLGSQETAEGLSPIEGEDLDFYLTELCGIKKACWTEAAVYIASGVDAREVVVLRLSDAFHTETVTVALEERRKERIGDFFGYAPDQAALLEGAVVLEQDGVAALLACPDVTAAKEAFAACLRGEFIPTVPTEQDTPERSSASESAFTPEPIPTPEPAPDPKPATTAESDQRSEAGPESKPESKPESEPKPELEPELEPEPEPEPEPALDISGFYPFNPPNEDDLTLYDTTAIRAAWASGDDSGLNAKDLAVLTRCREIFAACVTGDMSDFEKELALHDYLLEWGSYDQTIYDFQTSQGKPDNKNPYGMLVEGSGICLGYASSFQLLMDLAGIECITVIGAAYGSSEDHAWNMVRLEGEWYCVDPTWNDPTGLSRPYHRYFNVTSAYMRDTDHQWDYLNVPEANADYFYWNGYGMLPQ